MKFTSVLLSVGLFAYQALSINLASSCQSESKIAQAPDFWDDVCEKKVEGFSQALERIPDMDKALANYSQGDLIKISQVICSMPDETLIDFHACTFAASSLSEFGICFKSVSEFFEDDS